VGVKSRLTVMLVGHAPQKMTPLDGASAILLSGSIRAGRDFPMATTPSVGC